MQPKMNFFNLNESINIEHKILDNEFKKLEMMKLHSIRIKESQERINQLSEKIKLAIEQRKRDLCIMFEENERRERIEHIRNMEERKVNEIANRIAKKAIDRDNRLYKLKKREQIYDSQCNTNRNYVSNEINRFLDKLEREINLNIEGTKIRPSNNGQCDLSKFVESLKFL